MNSNTRIVNNVKNRGWISELQESGYKLTEPRNIILNFLKDQSSILSVDSIYLKLKKVYPQISIATVYRTLDLLSNLGLIKKIKLGSGKAYYLNNKKYTNKHSIYLICENCGKVIVNNKCLNNAVKIRLVDDAENNIFKNCSLRINNFQIFFSGLCDKCAI